MASLASASASAGTAPRQPAPRRARAERVDEILAAARAVFCEKGYAQAAVGEIAARVGVVEGLVYKYFPSKRALLLEVLAQWYEALFDSCTRDLSTTEGATARLHRVIWRHLRAVEANPLLCRLMFLEVRSERDYRGSRLHALNRRYTQLLIGVLEEGIASGSFRRDLPLPLLRDLIYGGIEHQSWNYVCGRGALDVERLAAQISSLVLCGIAAPSSSPALTRRPFRPASRKP